MPESKLEEQFKQLQELAKKDKSIDVAGLMVKALETHNDNFIPIKEKRWAYIVSIAVPLAGFYYVIKYFTSDKEDGLQNAMICTILSCFCLIITWIVSGTLSAGLSGGVPGQTASPQEVLDLIQ